MRDRARPLHRSLLGLGVVVLVVGLLGGTALADPPAPPASQGAPTPPGGGPRAGEGFHEHRDGTGEVDVNICSYETAPGDAHCNARIRTDDAAQQLGGALRAQGASPQVLPSAAAFLPADLQAAYGTTSSSASQGAGLTVAIVDAFDDPNAESDLAVYRAAAGLPPCTTANGCFRKVNQNGGTTYPAPNAGWAEEISLDIDMVSAMCPLCNILLVEATNNSFTNLGIAVNRAVTMGAIAVSNSYGGSEFSSETSADALYFTHPGVAVTASSGDSGFGVEYPAASPSVVAVGGTTLKRSGTGFTETAWSGAGSGCSSIEPKPAWQHDTGCSRRTVADVAAVADPATGVWVYDTFGGDPGWEIFGGTSVASPIVAAVYALASSGPWNVAPGSLPYANAGALHDVVGGSNGACGGSYLCTAVVGYDGPTGLGTPNTTAAFQPQAAPPPTPDFTIGAAPSTLTTTVGGSTSSTLSLTASGGFTGPVTLSASVSPASGLTATVAPSVNLTSTASVPLGLTASAAGSYTVTVTATAGALVHTTTVTVTVTAPDFSISVSPPSRSIRRGQSTTYTVAITRTGGFTGAVSLAVTGQTAADTATFAPASIASGATTSVLTVKTSTSDPRSTRTLTVTGTSGSLVHTTSATLTLK